MIANHVEVMVGLFLSQLNIPFILRIEVESNRNFDMFIANDSVSKSYIVECQHMDMDAKSSLQQADVYVVPNLMSKYRDVTLRCCRLVRATNCARRLVSTC